jgi:hypothetical protein
MRKKEKEAARGIKQALLELRGFAFRQPRPDKLDKSVDALRKAGALSPESGAFMRKHNVQIFGFSPNRIGHDIPMLAMGLATTKPPFRVIDFSDGTIVVEQFRATMTNLQLVARVKAKALERGYPADHLTNPRVIEAVCERFGGYGPVCDAEVYVDRRGESRMMAFTPKQPSTCGPAT